MPRSVSKCRSISGSERSGIRGWAANTIHDTQLDAVAGFIFAVARFGFGFCDCKDNSAECSRANEHSETRPAKSDNQKIGMLRKT